METIVAFLSPYNSITHLVQKKQTNARTAKYLALVDLLNNVATMDCGFKLLMSDNKC